MTDDDKPIVNSAVGPSGLDVIEELRDAPEPKAAPGVDFFKHMSPEMRERVRARKECFERDVAETRAMDIETLCGTVEYYLKNCEFPQRYQPGEPVYDGAMAHVVIPELLRRLKAHAQAVEAAVDAALGELQRQCGGQLDRQMLLEARNEGIARTRR